jgi:hypothetical protein
MRIQQTRQLWIKVPPVPEIVFGNNSAVFASLASLAKHGKDMHPHLRLVYTPFWLDDVHPYYLKKLWGQTKNGLPKVARDMFSEIYPEHADNNHITLGQMQQLRQTALHLLEHHYQIPVYHGEPCIERAPDQSFSVHVHRPGHKPQVFKTPSNTHFYNWYKVPRQHHLPGITQRSITEIYQQPPQSIPDDTDIIVLGSGLSVIWTAIDFATPNTSRNIICLKRASDQLNFNLPSNAAADPNRIISIDIARATISVAQDDPNLMIVYSHEHQKEFRGPFYSATGFELPSSIVTDIPQSQLTSPAKWKYSDLVAPKNITRGSLMESILQWYEETDNMEWGFEPQSYHKANNYFATFIKNNFSKDLNLDVHYFHALESAILNLNNPLPDNQVKPFLIKLYKDMYKPTSDQVSLFEHDLTQLFKQQLNFIETDEESKKPEFS